MQNCFEMYGADFMISDDFRTWLIEMNASPCMAPSTPITAHLVTEVTEDLMKGTGSSRRTRNMTHACFTRTSTRILVLPLNFYFCSYLYQFSVMFMVYELYEYISLEHYLFELERVLFVRVGLWEEQEW